MSVELIEVCRLALFGVGFCMGGLVMIFLCQR